MPIEKIFPSAMVILDICAAGIYGWKHDFWLMTYWLAVACLTFSVTFKP